MNYSALEAAERVLADVDSLIEHHPSQRDPKPGRPVGGDLGPLLRSCVTLCYTAWEVYVEESFKETVAWLLENKTAEELPANLREMVARERSNPWLYVGDGWKSVINDVVEAKIEGNSGKGGFNSASVQGVNHLYLKWLGFAPLLGIQWQGRTNDRVLEKIDLLVEVRGEIVHKGATPGNLNLGGVRFWAEFIRRLIEKFDEQLVEIRQ